MAKIDYDSFNEMSAEGTGNKIGFFSLKNDKDEAVVRFYLESPQDLDIHTVHSVEVNNHYLKVECLRTPKDSFDVCPLCAFGEKLQQKLYLKMLQYVRDENGQIQAVPKIWERSGAFARNMKSLLDEYGPLSNCIFKIRRNGAAGSMQTTYDIMFGNPAMYKESDYPKNFTCFENYQVLGNNVLDKSFDDMKAYIETGNFPQKNQARKVENREQEARTTQTGEGWVPQNTQTNDVVGWTAKDSTTPAPRRMPWQEQNQTTEVQRPNRFY